MSVTEKHNIKYVGLIPAAGQATRLKNLPCSKEIYLLRIHTKDGKERIQPACSCLLDSFRLANVNDITMIIRQGKEDIAKQLGDGKQYGVAIDYLYTQKPYGPPYTLDEAYSQVQGKYIATGFPDILFTPRHAIKLLIEKQQQTKAEVVLGLFHAPDPKKMDMVAFDQAGRIESIQIKPQHTTLVWTWVLTVWSPVYTEFMHQSLQKLLNEFETKTRTECHVGTFFQLALEAGMTFEHVFFNKGELVDIGTPEDLSRVEQVLARENWRV